MSIVDSVLRPQPLHQAAQVEPLDAAKALEAIIVAVNQGKPVPKEHARWLVLALRDFMDGKTRTMDEAFGLKPARGKRSLRTLLDQEKRDQLYRTIAYEMPPAPVSATATGICMVVDGYLAAPTEAADRARRQLIDGQFQQLSPGSLQTVIKPVVGRTWKRGD